jgi:putative transposase
VLLDAFVVMPNHVHGILILAQDKTVDGTGHHGADGHGNAVPLQEAFQRPVSGSIPTAVRSYKSAVTYLAHRALPHNGLRLWQSNYYERILRNDKEHLAAVRYIRENPSC